MVVLGLPDDAICFLAGLTKWSLSTSLVEIAVDRFPAHVLTVYVGGQFAAGQSLSPLALSGVLIALSLLGYYNRERIQPLAQRLNRLLPF